MSLREETTKQSRFWLPYTDTSMGELSAQLWGIKRETTMNMKRLISIFGILIFGGCVGMLPKIDNQHPAGYAKLITIIPECSNTDLNNYNACLASAQMLEVPTPQKATAKFISHWEHDVFGYAGTMKTGGMMRHDPLDMMVYDSVQRDSAAAIQRISVSVLKHIYKDMQNKYTETMSSPLDLIEAMSKSSFDTFREIHTKALSEAPSSP